MSATVTAGNAIAHGQPVAGLTEPGPVVPRHPPSTLAQMTKYWSVSKPLPGPIILDHQPPSPAACASPEKACVTRWRCSCGVQCALGFVGAIDRRKRDSAIEFQLSNVTMEASVIIGRGLILVYRLGANSDPTRQATRTPASLRAAAKILAAAQNCLLFLSWALRCRAVKRGMKVQVSVGQTFLDGFEVWYDAMVKPC